MGLSGQRKQQRIGADPNNLAWSTDTNKFGFKMLQKMGWTQGKGLGINEDGNTEHVKIRLKEDNLGVGADKKSIDNWLGSTDAFSSLLEELNNRMAESEALEKTEESDNKDKEEEKKKKKKEKKEKKKKEEKKEEVEETNSGTSTPRSISRLSHRTRYIRNKQVSGYDAQHLNEILGIKSNSASPAVSSRASPEPEKSSIDEELANSMKLKKSTMSAQEYFAMKMQNRRITGIASSGLGTNGENKSSTITMTTVTTTETVEAVEPKRKSTEEDATPSKKSK
ncbi:hypothetical protein K7432_009256 [Basidiobolus ranarum]|uniref:G-patch domain-containing protein n=1 Tax=Basidiobolus ranarum TaxID=34480 RepID=A0ABR2VXC1_9FUNG